MRHTSRWALATAIVVPLLLAPVLTEPFNGDNQLYQTMGWLLAHFHQLPYIGSWDQNFPGIVLLHASVISDSTG